MKRGEEGVGKGEEYFEYSIKNVNKNRINLRCIHYSRKCKAVCTITTNAIVTVSKDPDAKKLDWQLCPTNTTSHLTNVSNWGKIELGQKHDHICNQGQMWSRNVGTTPTHHRREYIGQAVQMKAQNLELLSSTILNTVNARNDVFPGLDGVRPIVEQEAKRAIRNYKYRLTKQPKEQAEKEDSGVTSRAK